MLLAASPLSPLAARNLARMLHASAIPTRIREGVKHRLAAKQDAEDGGRTSPVAEVAACTESLTSPASGSTIIRALARSGVAEITSPVSFNIRALAAVPSTGGEEEVEEKEVASLRLSAERPGSSADERPSNPVCGMEAKTAARLTPEAVPSPLPFLSTPPPEVPSPSAFPHGGQGSDGGMCGEVCYLTSLGEGEAAHATATSSGGRPCDPVASSLAERDGCSSLDSCATVLDDPCSGSSSDEATEGADSPPRLLCTHDAAIATCRHPVAVTSLRKPQRSAARLLLATLLAAVALGPILHALAARLAPPPPPPPLLTPPPPPPAACDMHMHMHMDMDMDMVGVQDYSRLAPAGRHAERRAGGVEAPFPVGGGFPGLLG